MATDRKVLNRMVVAEGETLFKEGDPGDRAYVIQEGVIEIFKARPDGNVTLGTVGKGGIIGEMALIDDEPRMASARALARSTVIVIGRDMFNRKLARCDPFIRGLLGIFVKNLRRMGEERAKA